MSTLTNQEFMKEFAAKIKKKRIMQGLNQQEVAQRAGIHINTLRQLESGDNSSLLTLISVLRVLRLENDLLNAIPPSPLSPIEAMKRKSTERLRVRKRALG